MEKGRMFDFESNDEGGTPYFYMLCVDGVHMCVDGMDFEVCGPCDGSCIKEIEVPQQALELVSRFKTSGERGKVSLPWPHETR